jgi:hypothetical protein
MTTGKQSKGDVITGSKGPVDVREEPLDHVAGDTITGAEGPVGQPSPEARMQGTFKGDGDRDWTDINNRIVAVSGVNVANFGDIYYTEDGDISDDDIAKIDADFQKAGAEPGQGKAVAEAAKQMGYGIKFTARKS